MPCYPLASSLASLFVCVATASAAAMEKSRHGDLLGCITCLVRSANGFLLPDSSLAVHTRTTNSAHSPATLYLS